MKKAVNFLRGSVNVSVEHPNPEVFLNHCAKAGLEFWELRRISLTKLQMTIHAGAYEQLSFLAQRNGADLKRLVEIGVPFFLGKLRRRHVLLACIGLGFLALWGMTLFIWEIDIAGNKTVPTQRIRAVLREHGVTIGAFGLGISTEALSNDVIVEIPELSWIAINVKGSHASVLVRERVPKPDILDKSAPTMVCASKSGRISKQSVLEGVAVNSIGTVVQAGDILVTGVMDSRSCGRRLVHAMAEIEAHTWYDYSAQMMLSSQEKVYSGKSWSKFALILAGCRLNIYFNGGISFDRYDKITQEIILKLPTGNTLPISIVQEKFSDYKPTDVTVDLLDAEEILQKSLLDRLRSTIGTGKIVTTAFESAEAGGVLRVTLKAECAEPIALERPFTEEELRQAQLTPEISNETGN